MKFIGTFKEVLHTDTSIRVTFDIGKQYYRTVNELSKERLLEIEVNEKRGQRSLNQNRLLWELIHQIDLAENGRVDKDSEMNLYMNLIKMSKIRIDYFQTLREAKEMLQNAYRVVEEKESRISKGVETVVYACYRGSSHFNKEEMKNFIEATLDYASQCGLNIETYVDELSLKPIRQIHD